MRLSELGELGLLAELERRGLAPSAFTSDSTGSLGAIWAGAPRLSTSATLRHPEPTRRACS